MAEVFLTKNGQKNLECRIKGNAWEIATTPFRRQRKRKVPRLGSIKVASALSYQMKIRTKWRFVPIAEKGATFQRKSKAHQSAF